jgi:hypothetical protein
LQQLITSILIPASKYAQGDKARGRALAYIAHEYLGDYFRTAYDISTILIRYILFREGDTAPVTEEIPR